MSTLFRYTLPVDETRWKVGGASEVCFTWDYDASSEALLALYADDVELVRTVRAGGAASVLTAEAEGADLLVVGARGLGGFRGLLLGSVSQQTVAHSPCPVVVVTRERD
jgi:nucleotide-binding universal stress UspA family protein